MDRNLASEIENFIRNIDVSNYNIVYGDDSQYSGMDFVINGFDVVDNSIRITDLTFVNTEDEFVSFSASVSYRISFLAEADNYNTASYDKEDDEWYNVEVESVNEEIDLTINDLEIELNTETGLFNLLVPPVISIDINLDRLNDI